MKSNTLMVRCDGVAAVIKHIQSAVALRTTEEEEVKQMEARLQSDSEIK